MIKIARRLRQEQQDFRRLPETSTPGNQQNSAGFVASRSSRISAGLSGAYTGRAQKQTATEALGQLARDQARGLEVELAVTRHGLLARWVLTVALALAALLAGCEVLL